LAPDVKSASLVCCPPRHRATATSRRDAPHLHEIIAELPPERRARVEARYRELRQEVESLRELRRLTGKAHADIAAGIKDETSVGLDSR
jgi:hypothetical protein